MVDVGGGVVVEVVEVAEDLVLGAGAAEGGVDSVLLRVKMTTPATARATTTVVATPMSHHFVRGLREFACGAVASLPGQPPPE